MSTRAFSFRWTWLIAASLSWVVVAYPVCLWGMGHDRRQAFETSLSECGPLERYNGYAYAQCIQAAADGAADRESRASETAALVSIGPIAVLWLAIFLSRFVRVCRTTDGTYATPGSFYRNAQRRRWKAP